jgi:hypothetical protein
MTSAMAVSWELMPCMEQACNEGGRMGVLASTEDAVDLAFKAPAKSLVHLTKHHTPAEPGMHNLPATRVF